MHCSCLFLFVGLPTGHPAKHMVDSSWDEVNAHALFSRVWLLLELLPVADATKSFCSLRLHCWRAVGIQPTLPQLFYQRRGIRKGRMARATQLGLSYGRRRGNHGASPYLTFVVGPALRITIHRSAGLWCLIPFSLCAIGSWSADRSLLKQRYIRHDRCGADSAV